MPTGTLLLRVTDLRGEPVEGNVRVRFDPARGSAGGSPATATFQLAGETDLTIDGISTRGGTGTLYEVRVKHRHFRQYGCFQIIHEGGAARASDWPIRLRVEPGRVKDIDAPPFSKLPAALHRSLATARMQAPRAEDRDLVGLQGGPLYAALGPLRRAALLNIFTKAAHPSADRTARFVSSLFVARQDRCFCAVAADLPERVRESAAFQPVPGTLHEPLAGWVLEQSFKSRDAHANLQLTFMRHPQSGAFAADIDIDEATGIRHGFEVIRNAITRGRTNPYLVRELLLLADIDERSLDPGYRFVFAA